MNADLGPQGGSVKATMLDLSSCVNPYGPPPAVIDALSSIGVSAIREHPYHAGDHVAEIYACYFGASADRFVAGRGISGLIWELSRHLAASQIAIPLPAYTEYLTAFPQALTIRPKGYSHSPDQLLEALTSRPYAIISNPHNPSGALIPRAVLVDLALECPHSTLIIDESYMDFVQDGPLHTLVASSAENVVVLRSPTKFYGMAGIRVGAAYIPDGKLRDALFGRTDPWPVSALDAALLWSALTSSEWARMVRDRLASDRTWLQDYLTTNGCRLADGQMHFGLIINDPEHLCERLTKNGIGLRQLASAHGFDRRVTRMSAPRYDARPVISAI